VREVSAAGWKRQFNIIFSGWIEVISVPSQLLREELQSEGINIPRTELVSSIDSTVAQPFLALCTCRRAETAAIPSERAANAVFRRLSRPTHASSGPVDQTRESLPSSNASSKPNVLILLRRQFTLLTCPRPRSLRRHTVHSEMNEQIRRARPQGT
jgi:hypothetical protein